MLFDDAVVQSKEPSRFRFPVPLTDEHPDYVISAASWADLATAISARLEKLGPFVGGVTLASAFTAELERTIERFNVMADNGKDTDFGRGETPIEQAWAQSPRAGAATGSMHRFAAEGPYHCVIVGPGALDTKGGPVVDEHARVLATSGAPVPGLYGAGNCIASPAGQAYWGAGGTIGLAFTYGYIAGRNAAREDARTPG
jgi:succinate dehydrogenase/fumarate reductase flavoprotein subunit